MARATELTRAGRLSEATALIQSALQGTRIPPQGPLAGLLPADVIDVTARVVDAPEQAPSVASGNMPPPPAARQAPQDAAAFIAGRYTAAAGSRAYKVFVPPAAADRPLPLIVMLHGCTQDPDDFARGTGMNQIGREHG